MTEQTIMARLAAHGLTGIYEPPPKFQAIIEAAATGDAVALLDYAKAIEELADSHSLTPEEACAMVEPVALMAAVNGGHEAKLFLAATVRRFAVAAFARPRPLSRLDEARGLASWWQAVAIYEELARAGHDEARQELAAVLHEMEEARVHNASAAIALFQEAELA